MDRWWRQSRDQPPCPTKEKESERMTKTELGCLPFDREESSGWPRYCLAVGSTPLFPKKKQPPWLWCILNAWRGRQEGEIVMARWLSGHRRRVWAAVSASPGCSGLAAA
ncbi:hypothetical protein L249_4153 [Ophiocordyceps polyrhachis-furcata BCC 54312]|uniref:Uncharacterized protein n=1 Tax=Ophiocordyceps polyrhachis-furcata BCC 54312 TaxID=1330021 RepID=A0A367L5W0_9HYPO|nr:hypothetical protein L249_4153 [Ophiocordyceps polyrhachis-furcata BCC 54312]